MVHVVRNNHMLDNQNLFSCNYYTRRKSCNKRCHTVKFFMIISTNNLKFHTINIMEFFILTSILLAHLKECELPYNHISYE